MSAIVFVLAVLGGLYLDVSLWNAVGALCQGRIHQR
jgi:cytochrome c-type biogenesis protein CcmH/NrfG